MAAMVEITEQADGGYAHPHPDRPTVMDPACGSGRLLIAVSRRHPGGWFFGVDKDAMCAKMAALNCCLFNLDATSYHGDSLRVDVHQAWETRGSVLGGEVERREPTERDEQLLAGATSDADADERGRGDEAFDEDVPAEAMPDREPRQVSLEDVSTDYPIKNQPD